MSHAVIELSQQGVAMTLHALLLRMAHLDSSVRIVALLGEEVDEAIFTQTGFTLCPADQAQLLIAWDTSVPADARPKLIVRIGSAPTAVPGYTLLFSGPFSFYDSLNAWARRIALPEQLRERSAHWLRRAGAADVVGSRMCKLRHPGWHQAVLLREGEPLPIAARVSRGDRFRDLSMSFGGIGHTPLFAANTASLVTAGFAFGIWIAAGWAVMWAVLVVTLLLAVAGCVAFEKWAAVHYLTDDAREVVLDEVAGMSLTLLMLAPSMGWLAFPSAFVAFRIFDIFKPGIHWIEETGWRGTIVWDDLLAGTYAGGSVLLCWRLWQWCAG